MNRTRRCVPLNSESFTWPPPNRFVAPEILPSVESRQETSHTSHDGEGRRTPQATRSDIERHPLSQRNIAPCRLWAMQTPRSVATHGNENSWRRSNTSAKSLGVVGPGVPPIQRRSELRLLGEENSGEQAGRFACERRDYFCLRR